MMRDRSSSVGACSEIARFTCTCSSRERVDLVDESDGRDRDVAVAQAEAVRIVEQRYRLHHRVVVVERLAHAHEHDVGDPLAARCELAREEPRLVEDLAGGQVAAEPGLTGRAERARKRAARLRRDAERRAVAEMLHEHGFDFFAVAQPKEPLVVCPSRERCTPPARSPKTSRRARSALRATPCGSVVTLAGAAEQLLRRPRDRSGAADTASGRNPARTRRRRRSPRAPRRRAAIRVRAVTDFEETRLPRLRPARARPRPAARRAWRARL